MIPFSKYARMKDYYCIRYTGYADEYLTQLRLLKPALERHFPGIRVSFMCQDAKAHLLGPDAEVVPASLMKSRQHDFACVRDLRFNGVCHPVQELLEECGVRNYAVPVVPREPDTYRFVILTRGNYPTKDLERRDVDALKRRAKEEGFAAEVDGPAENAGVVAGVESPGLFEAAAAGVRTILVPTGFGTRLYERMFPSGEVLHI